MDELLTREIAADRYEVPTMTPYGEEVRQAFIDGWDAAVAYVRHVEELKQDVQTEVR